MGTLHFRVEFPVVAFHFRIGFPARLLNFLGKFPVVAFHFRIGFPPRLLNFLVKFPVVAFHFRIGFPDGLVDFLVEFPVGTLYFCRELRGEGQVGFVDFFGQGYIDFGDPVGQFVGAVGLADKHSAAGGDENRDDGH